PVRARSITPELWMPLRRPWACRPRARARKIAGLQSQTAKLTGFRQGWTLRIRFRPARVLSRQFFFFQLFFSQFLPHPHHSGFQFGRQPFIGGLARLIQRRRLNGLAEYHLQIGELRQGFVARPSFIKPLDRDWNDRSLRVNRENRGTLAEYSRVAVVGALALGIENQDVSLAQAKSSGAHGGHQVRV